MCAESSILEYLSAKTDDEAWIVYYYVWLGKPRDCAINCSGISHFCIFDKRAISSVGYKFSPIISRTQFRSYHRSDTNNFDHIIGRIQFWPSYQLDTTSVIHELYFRLYYQSDTKDKFDHIISIISRIERISSTILSFGKKLTISSVGYNFVHTISWIQFRPYISYNFVHTITWIQFRPYINYIFSHILTTHDL